MTAQERAYAKSRVFDVTRAPEDGRVIRTPQRDVELALPIEEVQTGELRRYKLHFPFVPPSKNKYDGWPPGWKASAKRKWEKAVREQCEALQIPKGNRHIGLAAVVWFTTNRGRDSANFAQCLWNFVPDGLQKAGVLVNDRHQDIDYGFGKTLGVKFLVDTRTTLPKAKRERTVVGLTIRVRPDKP